MSINLILIQLAHQNSDIIEIMSIGTTDFYRTSFTLWRILLTFYPQKTIAKFCVTFPGDNKSNLRETKFIPTTAK